MPLKNIYNPTGNEIGFFIRVLVFLVFVGVWVILDLSTGLETPQGHLLTIAFFMTWAIFDSKRDVKQGEAHGV